MNILLLGGTGSMGNHLANILLLQGSNVFVTSRTKRNSVNNINYIQGNAKDLVFLEELLDNKWDAIIDFMIYNDTEFKDRIDRILNSTNHYFYLSSARVYSDCKKKITEDHPRLLDSSTDQEFLLTDEYSLSKARQENILDSKYKKNWTIIRPYITYSENRLQLGVLEKENWLYRALKDRTIVFTDEIKEHFTTFTYGYDVANSIASLINNSRSFGEKYHITVDESCKWSKVLEIYLDVLEKRTGKRPKVLFSNLNKTLKFTKNKYQIVYDRLFDRRFDSSKISEFINIHEFKKIEDGIKESLNTFLDNPIFLEIDWRSEAKNDKFSKEKTPLKEIPSLKSKIKYIMFRYLL